MLKRLDSNSCWDKVLLNWWDCAVRIADVCPCTKFSSSMAVYSLSRFYIFWQKEEQWEACRVVISGQVSDADLINSHQPRSTAAPGT